jgi:hypothetical protein
VGGKGGGGCLLCSPEDLVNKNASYESTLKLSSKAH